MFSRARPVCPLTVRGGQKFQITGLQRVLSKANQTFAMFAKPPAPRGLQVFLLSSLTLARAPFSLNSCNTLNFLFTRNAYFCWCFSSMGEGRGIKLKKKKNLSSRLEPHVFSTNGRSVLPCQTVLYLQSNICKTGKVCCISKRKTKLHMLLNIRLEHPATQMLPPSCHNDIIISPFLSVPYLCQFLK